MTRTVFVTTAMLSWAALCVGAVLAAPTVLEAPTWVSIEARSPTEIELRWTDVRREAFYEIERARSAAGPWRVIVRVPRDTVSYLDTGLLPETRYFYRMRAGR